MELAANHRGVTFIRTSRPTTPVIYKPDEVFKIGEGKVRKGGGCRGVAGRMGCGVTVTLSSPSCLGCPL